MLHNLAKNLKPCLKETVWGLVWSEFHRNAFWQTLSLVILCNSLRTSYQLSSWQDCNEEAGRSAIADCRETISWENRLLSWWPLPKGEAPEGISAVENKAERASQSWVSERDPVPGALPSLVVSTWLLVLLEEPLLPSIIHHVCTSVPLWYPSSVTLPSQYLLSQFFLSGFRAM